MPELSIDLLVEAPADSVWEVVGHRFDRIGEWATAIPASAAIPAPTGTTPGCPVAGRVCETGMRLLPRVTETLVACDEVNRTLTYEASRMPSFVTTARNTWTVSPIDERCSRVRLRAQFDTRGLLGRLVRWAIRHYVEHSVPSPRKQAQLRRDQRRSIMRPQSG